MKFKAYAKGFQAGGVIFNTIEKEVNDKNKVQNLLKVCELYPNMIKVIDEPKKTKKVVEKPKKTKKVKVNNENVKLNKK